MYVLLIPLIKGTIFVDCVFFFRKSRCSLSVAIYFGDFLFTTAAVIMVHVEKLVLFISFFPDNFSRSNTTRGVS